MTNKEKYIEFCGQKGNVPVFSQPWWLDAVCQGEWDVILIEQNGKIIASFPYYKKMKAMGIFTYIEMPKLSQKLGPYIVYDSDKSLKESKKIAYEHEIYNAIIDKLPKFDNFVVNFDWKYKNWLPFYWRGFKQTTRYTYLLDNIKDHDNRIKNYAKYKKQNIQKAKKKKLTIKYDLSKEAFYSYFESVICEERKESVSFSKKLFERLYDAIHERKTGRTFFCVDKNDNIHAISMVVWDNECAYEIISMRKNKHNNSGGTEFLRDAVIKYVSQFVNRFDIGGSMIKGVEKSYRDYGTQQTEYYSISKCNSWILRIIKGIKEENRFFVNRLRRLNPIKCVPL